MKLVHPAVRVVTEPWRVGAFHRAPLLASRSFAPAALRMTGPLASRRGRGGTRASEASAPSVDCGPGRAEFCMEDAMDRLPFPGGRTAGSGVGHFHVSVQVGSR